MHPTFARVVIWEVAFTSTFEKAIADGQEIRTTLGLSGCSEWRIGKLTPQACLMANQPVYEAPLFYSLECEVGLRSISGFATIDSDIICLKRGLHHTSKDG
jgi:hypothetical protein